MLKYIQRVLAHAGAMMICAFAAQAGTSCTSQINVLNAAATPKAESSARLDLLHCLAQEQHKAEHGSLFNPLDRSTAGFVLRLGPPLQLSETLNTGERHARRAGAGAADKGCAPALRLRTIGLRPRYRETEPNALGIALRIDANAAAATAKSGSDAVQLLTEHLEGAPFAPSFLAQPSGAAKAGNIALELGGFKDVARVRQVTSPCDPDPARPVPKLKSPLKMEGLDVTYFNLQQGDLE